jgi:hypothetical protein
MDLDLSLIKTTFELKAADPSARKHNNIPLGPLVVIIRFVSGWSTASKHGPSQTTALCYFTLFSSLAAHRRGDDPVGPCQTAKISSRQKVAPLLVHQRHYDPVKLGTTAAAGYRTVARLLTVTLSTGSSRD